jgi:hypothetical protein
MSENLLIYDCIWEDPQLAKTYYTAGEKCPEEIFYGHEN